MRAEDWRVSCETIAEHILRILAKLWHQARLTTAPVIMVRYADEKWGARVPGNEDVGVFTGGIAFLLQEVGLKFRRDDREKTCSEFLLVHSRTASLSPPPAGSLTNKLNRLVGTSW